MNAPRKVYITERDAQRLEALIETLKASNLTMLEDELQNATIVKSEEIPRNVVTMNSQVHFRDIESGDESKVDLVFPLQANIDAGRLSVLAPIGSALLGMSEGDEIEWPMPSGRTRKLRIIQVIFQPEAEGRFDL